MHRPPQSAKTRTRERGIAILLVFCVVLVAFWETAALFSRRPFQPFQLTAEDFRSFKPAAAGWLIRSMPVAASPAEPNILAYELTAMPGMVGTGKTPDGHVAAVDRVSGTGPVLVRLVHGYNMCDCMRIKGYRVELIREVGRQMPEAADQRSESGSLSTEHSARDNGERAARRQVWRLTSSSGEVSVWITGMIKAGDFSETDVDVRSMAFPRVGVPDDPRWVPRGVTWKSLRHPLDNMQSFLRSKWNSSRCDLATFLGLRQPAWANDELLTLVAAWRGPPVPREREESVSEPVLAAYDALYVELEKWRTADVAR